MLTVQKRNRILITANYNIRQKALTVAMLKKNVKEDFKKEAAFGLNIKSRTEGQVRLKREHKARSSGRKGQGRIRKLAANDLILG